MKVKFNTLLGPALLGASLLQLTACGGGGGERSGSDSSESQPRHLEADAEGMYVAEMKIMNRGVGGAISASFSVSKDGPRMIAYMRFNGGQPRVSHHQRVHVGTSCPTEADDKNNDGYVDVNEAFESVGKILFPLDADISAQERGSSLWPMSDIYGYYHWERATAFDRFISDLREPDLNGENDFAKLGPNGALNLDGRVVLIHGAAPDVSNLPDTVATRGRLNNYQTIPVACGVIRKVRTVPGVVEDDPSLGAAGEGETVGGSSGADDGATVPVEGAYRPETTTGENTTRTNDTGNDPRGNGTDPERTTSGGSGGNTTGGSTSGGSTTSGSTTSGSTTSGSTTSGSTTGGSTSGGTTGAASTGTTGTSYGDDDE